MNKGLLKLLLIVVVVLGFIGFNRHRYKIR